MLSRRNLRRNAVWSLLIPSLILTFLIIHQLRSSSSSTTADQVLNHYDELDDHDVEKSFTRITVKTTTNSELKSVVIERNTPNISSNNNQQKLVKTNQVEYVPNWMTKNSTVPLIVINTNGIERFVHLDLKGAAPKVSYYEKLFPYIKSLGATGLLIEYEDMFPFTDHLSVIQNGFAYSRKEIEFILKLAEDNQLKVMPLLQVYGHLEYVLKLNEFRHLREDFRYPQVITPCLDETYTLLFQMIDQLLELHPSIPYLHIGCDEVYYRLIHPKCPDGKFSNEGDLFIRHVVRIAKYIKSKRPLLKLFVWHDMLSQLANEGNMNVTELLSLVVPMVWAYVENIKSWFDETFWIKFMKFPEIWIASSFKGSSGETTTMSYIGHHQRNQQTWLEAMYIASIQYKLNFTGIAITGWSRYDHMLSLCEFLPSSIPSLAYNLQTIVHGQLTQQLNETISEKLLGCMRMPYWERPSHTTFVSCRFPGHEVYEVMYKHDGVMKLYEETMNFVRLYLTDIHIGQNYIHFKRAQECFERLLHLENEMIHFMDVFQNTCQLFFTSDTGPEWLQTYFIKYFNEVQQKNDFIEKSLRTQSIWQQRPMTKNISRLVFKRRNVTLTNRQVAL